MQYLSYSGIRYVSLMSTVNERLQQVRKDAGYSSATEAAEAFGWNVNTYRSHENGARGLRFDILSRYARAFSASLSWLITGAGDDKKTILLRLSGSVQDRSIVIDHEDEALKSEVILPFSVPRNAVCLSVETSSLYPRYAEGDLLICWDSIASRQALDQRSETMIEAIVLLPEDIEVLGSIQPKHMDSIELVGRPPLRGVTIERVIPVQAVVRSGLWSTASYEEAL